MAAFNYIKADVTCPVCQRTVEMKFQTHIASDFEGDATGRFMERDYRLGGRGATHHDTSLGPFAAGFVPKVCCGPTTAALSLLASDEKLGARSRAELHHGLLGDEMAWFDRSHEDFDCWMTWGMPTRGPVYEYCHATCDACDAELYGRIEFKDLKPTRVSEVGSAGNWPTDPASPEIQYPPVLAPDDTTSSV